jgi:hypothetical protein
VRPLTTDGESPTVTEATIGLQIDETLDVHREFFAQLAFNAELTLDHIADPSELGVGQVVRRRSGVDVRLLTNETSGVVSDTVDGREGDLGSLSAGKINT